MRKYKTPTFNLRFVEREGRKILQQRFDTSTFADGRYEIASEWKDVQVEDENKEVAR